MDDLVETLTFGLLASVILIFISWWFWKRYDEPSEAQIEREESIAQKKKETQMWRAVESQMNQEKAALEEQALYERRKAEERARAIPPPTGEVANAFAAFETPSQTPVNSFTEHPDAAPPAEAALLEHELEIEVNDDDVREVEELMEVRQDQGVVFEEHEIIPERHLDLENDRVLDSDEVTIPAAPDLDVLSATSSNPVSEQEWSLDEEEESLETDWSDNWFKNLEEE